MFFLEEKSQNKNIDDEWADKKGYKLHFLCLSKTSLYFPQSFQEFEFQTYALHINITSTQFFSVCIF